MRSSVAALAMVMAAAAAACAPVRYVEFDEAHAPYPMVADRTVGFELSERFYDDPPACVAIVPEAGAGGRAAAAFARHLSQRVPTLGGRGCAFRLHLRPWKTEQAFMLVWAHRQVGLEAELRRIEDGAVLWRARHADRRSEGGVPMSPVAALTASFDAAGLMADEDDVVLSLLDDVCRRMVLTFPDTRGQPRRLVATDAKS